MIAVWIFAVIGMLGTLIVVAIAITIFVSWILSERKWRKLSAKKKDILKS